MSTSAVRTGQHFVLDYSTWDLYESILAHIGDRNVFITFDCGRLELMAPSWRHDRRSRLIARLIDIVAEEASVPIQGGGSATIRRKSLQRGLEADQWFYVANVAAVQGKSDIDPERDPPPDLAVEVEISRRILDREGIYAAMGVPELWRDDGERVRMFVLGPDRCYQATASSRSFPVLDAVIVGDLLAAARGHDDTSWGRLVRERVRARIASAG